MTHNNVGAHMEQPSLGTWMHELRVVLILELMYQQFLIEFDNTDTVDNRDFFGRGYWVFMGGKVH
jgi:hypothetical protein